MSTLPRATRPPSTPAARLRLAQERPGSVSSWILIGTDEATADLVAQLSAIRDVPAPAAVVRECELETLERMIAEIKPRRRDPDLRA
jgi:hypothetical protein